MGDAILTHPTMAEGLTVLVANVTPLGDGTNVAPLGDGSGD
jgi:hypothetical protein